MNPTILLCIYFLGKSKEYLTPACAAKLITIEGLDSSKIFFKQDISEISTIENFQFLFLF